MTALTGDALKAKLAELGQCPENTAAIECGYVTKAGKASLAAFRQAQLEAHGLAIAKPARGAGGRRGKSLSFMVTTGKTGNIVMAGGYAALLGIEPGGQVAISHQGNSLVLTAAEPTEAVTEAAIETATPAVCAAPAVVTYDSTPAPAPELAMAA